MRRFSFLLSRYVIIVILVGILVLLGVSIYLGLKSAGQMRQIVKEDFNQQQLVLAQHTASILEQDLEFLKRELRILNHSASVQYLEELTWAHRMRVTLSSVREEGVVEIRRINREGNKAYLVDERSLEHIITGSYKKTPYFEWARQPENKGRVYVSRVITQLPNYFGRLIMIIATPTYDESVDESHPHPSGQWSGVLAFYIDVHYLAHKFTSEIRSGKTGYAWIMDNQGTFLYHPEEDFIGKNAFTVRKARMPAISFDAINEIQREKMLTGQEGWGTYISGWHRGEAGVIQKLIAYAPVKLTGSSLAETAGPASSWSVAVVAPVSEVEGVIHTIYQRQFLIQVIIGVFVLLSSVVLLNYRYEREFTATLEEEVNRKTEELHRSEARYQALVENAADLIYSVDTEGRIQSINRCAACLFSLARSMRSKAEASEAQVEVRPEDFIGRTFYDIFDKKSADFHLEWLQEIKGTGLIRSKRHPVTVKGKEFWFSTSIVGLRDEQGQIYAYEIISRDVTGRKAMEDRLINMEKLASLGTMAAGVAHEINNPVAVILGFTEHLLEKTADLPDIHETLQVVEEEGLKCKKIVENLLTFARTPERAEISANINEILEKTLAVMKNNLMTKKIQQECSLTPDLPRVKGDPQELQQVFINLINNAIDAMKGGGILRIKTWLTAKNQVAIEFGDTGVGIPKELQAKIFDPFFTTKKTGEGTGLGLSMSYGIITKFGGKIICKSYPEKEYPDKHGTTFIVYLPVFTEAESEAPPLATEAEVLEDQAPRIGTFL
ncbi:MAG: PAS domain S-box protein [Deltaproteobacteria bacterium]|nr:PAS domain S-box protein [Deltaproteobacteria bacterium]